MYTVCDFGCVYCWLFRWCIMVVMTVMFMVGDFGDVYGGCVHECICLVSSGMHNGCYVGCTWCW